MTTTNKINCDGCKICTNTCSICLGKMKHKHYIAKTFCNHFFHAKCMDKWIENDINNSKKYKSCPLCRENIYNMCRVIHNTSVDEEHLKIQKFIRKEKRKGKNYIDIYEKLIYKYKY